MTLNEWIAENGDKDIKLEDGKIEVIEPEESRRWKPKHNEPYYLIDRGGRISYEPWIDHEVDLASFAIGDVFKTREDAEFARERMKIRAELLDCGGREAWKSDEEERWVICNDPYRGLTAFKTCAPTSFTIGFDTRELANEVIKKVGEDRIKKYLFGVDDEAM